MNENISSLIDSFFAYGGFGQTKNINAMNSRDFLN